MGRYDLIADDGTAGGSDDVGAAINGMKSLCGLCTWYGFWRLESSEK